ncbi:WD40-like Beta Propeller Repeat [Micromonospora viridifaciens]|uniref:WD40-like Beta Propeller Repeat n=1 Tax=Micromonospora viridifaciens TaxID=1881 RepID=A0A1C4UF93_MICVI|nr:PD40 domain-containing protein [Micromonospora viridifaciens]SCE70343.1 WD40-like Beta Propeller Repeat [Micromonospora viridifaciens]
MSRHTEDVLRTVVRDLANGAQTAPELAGRALRQGRRLRRWRRAAAAGGALAAIAVLAGPFVWLRPDAPPRATEWAAPPAAPTTTPATARPPSADWTRTALKLPGGWIVTGATSTGTPAEKGYALDRDRRRYVAAGRYEEVWAAPRDNVAAVVDYERPGEVGLFDLGTGKVRWVRVGSYLMTPRWSPDGRRLALTLLDKDSGRFSLGVLTVSTGAYRTYPVDSRYLCTDQCFFTWGPDGREVVFQQTEPSAPRSESEPHRRRGVQFFSAADGRPTRFAPIPGDPAGAWSWSPDGRLVVVKGQAGPKLVEVKTGREVAAAPAADAVWVTDEQLLYRDPVANEMVLVDLDGRELARQALPAELGLNMMIMIAPN